MVTQEKKGQEPKPKRKGDGNSVQMVAGTRKRGWGGGEQGQKWGQEPGESGQEPGGGGWYIVLSRGLHCF